MQIFMKNEIQKILWTASECQTFFESRSGLLLVRLNCLQLVETASF